MLQPMGVMQCSTVSIAIVHVVIHVVLPVVSSVY